MVQELIEISCVSAIRSSTIADHRVRLNCCTPPSHAAKVVSRNTHNKLGNFEGERRAEAEGG